MNDHLSFLHGQEIVELAGYTARVGNMLQVFEDVQKGHYQRPSIMADGDDGARSNCGGSTNLVFRNGMPVINGKLTVLNLAFFLL